MHMHGPEARSNRQRVVVLLETDRCRCARGRRVLRSSGGAHIDLGGYSILQAESKEALAKTLEGHPHFMMPDGSIDIVEVMPLPGS